VAESGPITELRFTVPERRDVLDQMAVLADGSGWLVLDPAVHEDDVPPSSVFGTLFLAKGPEAPELSWVPGERGGRRVEPLAVGIRHAAGPKAKRRLAEVGHPVPEGWYVVQDNPRRGLVAQVPETEPHEKVLDWLLLAAVHLATVPLTGEWRARVYRR
jgi:hypothetical protein